MSRRFVSLIVVCLLASLAAARPRPVNDAERAAVAIVAKHLARGPAALHAALTPDAPLRALPYDAAVAELEARTGPFQGATWKLQTADSNEDVAFHVTFPSGYDDALLFRMKETERGWLLREVRTIGEPPTRSAPRAVPTPVAPRGMLMVLAVLALVTLFAALRRVRFAAVAFAACSALFLVAAVSRGLPQQKEIPFIELRDALPVREALARGETVRIPESLSKEARAVALLWVLQSGREAMISGTDADPFSGLGVMAATPLGQLVRARIESSSKAFKNAASIAPLRDDLLSEAAAAAEGKEAAAYLQRLLAIGSRDAATYYAEARNLVAHGDMARAADAFRIGWNLQPLTREELVRDTQLFRLMRDDSIQQLVSFFGTHEPLRAARGAGSRPLALPPNARPFVLGDLLRVSIGEATLEVPGGAALAPMTAYVMPATQWERERDAADLCDAEWLLGHPSVIDASTTLRLVRATDALARHRRWDDVLAMASRHRASPVLVARIRALVRLKRFDEAIRLAAGNDVRELLETKRDPGALMAIADAMVAARGYGLAESLYAAVRGTAFERLADARLKQVELRRALLTTGRVTVTDHFDIRHHDSVTHYDATRLGDTLERELANLQRRLPAIQFQRVAVNILDDADFRVTAGSDQIRGQYDGEILLPLSSAAASGDASTIVHELTHALVAQLTRDNAPRWFQEGLAERMEPQPPPAPRRVYPVTLLDAIIDNAIDEGAMRDGYCVAYSFIHFLERRYGEGTIVALLEAFAAGKTTDEALAHATGKSTAALDAELRASVDELAPVADVVGQDVLAEAVH